MENVLNNLKGRRIYSEIIKKMEKTSETEWFIDTVRMNPGMRFDSSGDIWNGLRHLENIFFLKDNRYGGFNSWNQLAACRQIEQVKKVLAEIRKKQQYYYSVENELYSMMGY